MSITLEWLIENLPLIMVYFVPGYIFLCMFCFFTSKKIKEIENLFVRSVVISYIFVVIANLLCTLLKFNSKYEIYIALSLSVITSFISVRIYFSKIYKNFMSKFGNISGHTSIWEDLFDRKKGAKIRGYVKYKEQCAEIKGTVKYYDILDDGNCNIALWNYTIDCPEFEILAKEDPSRLFFIKSCDLEMLEVFQGAEKQNDHNNIFVKLKKLIFKK